jgi:hypothetical protein
VLSVVRVTVDEALAMVESGEIQDAKTLLALLKARPYLGAK